MNPLINELIGKVPCENSTKIKDHLKFFFNIIVQYNLIKIICTFLKGKYYTLNEYTYKTFRIIDAFRLWILFTRST